MNPLIPPKVEMLSEWETFHLPFSIGSGRSFFPDSNGESALRMAFFKSKKDSSLVGKVWFGRGIEGPPNHVHGGVSSYVLDEAMGSAGWLNNYPCVAKTISFEFLKMTPVGVDLNIEAKVKKTEGKSILIECRIFDENEDLTRGSGQFHWLDKKRMQSLLAKGPYQLDLAPLKFPES